MKLKDLKNKLKNNKLLVQNFSYLSILKLATILLPLLTYPYLITKLGASKYGLLIYAQAIVNYFRVLINFGFGITVTRDIAKNIGDIKNISKIVSSTYLIKTTLFIISFALLGGLGYFVSDIKNHFQLFFYTMLWLAFYEVFFPIYYFQGLEKMKYITIISLINRSIFFICIFIFIKKESDYILFPLLNFFGSLVAVIFSWYILFKDGVRIKLPTKNFALRQVKQSYIMGIAIGSNTLKSNLNTILIKNVLSFREVAIFDLAYKVVSIGLTFIDLINQTVFPRLAREKNKYFFKKLIKLVSIISIIAIIAIIAFGEFIVNLLGNYSMTDAYPVLVIMSILIPVYSLGSLLGRNCLNIYGYDKQLLYSMLFSSLFYVVVFCTVKYVFHYDFSIFSFVWIFLISYLVDTLYRFVACKKLKLI